MISDPWFYAVAIPAVLLSAINKGGFASGLGVLSVPMIALTVPPLQAAAIMLPVLCTMDVFAIWSYRRQWDRANMRVMLPAGVIGVAVGWLSAGMLTDNSIKVIVGLIAVAFTLHYWIGARDLPPERPNVWKGSVWSSVAGYTSFLAHAGGPPLNMYLLPQRLDKARFVATTVIFWGAINYLKLIPYAALGQFDNRNLLASLVLLPLTPLGIRIGIWMNRRLTPFWFYRICYALTFAVGAKLLWDGGSGLLV
jgi:uncharacterized membrane protein YfcA